jgi:hypothetical protein
MEREGHNNVAFFVGPEVEQTPAYSKRTLFVVGKQDLATIEKLARENKTPHIFMGANHSFGFENPGDNSYWDKTITALLDRGFWVTLDYPAHQHDVVLTMLNPGIWQSRIFVPLLSVRIPKIQTSSVNLTVKIDDIDFKATNPGVWCMHFHEVTDSNRFTDWQDYGTDVVIAEETVVNPVEGTWAGGVSVPVTAEPVIVKAEEPVVKNQPELGIDTTPTTALKPESDKEETKENNVVADPEKAAEIYAEGATEDPLGKNAPKKTKVTKKVETS